MPISLECHSVTEFGVENFKMAFITGGFDGLKLSNRIGLLIFDGKVVKYVDTGSLLIVAREGQCSHVIGIFNYCLS